MELRIECGFANGLKQKLKDAVDKVCKICISRLCLCCFVAAGLKTLNPLFGVELKLVRCTFFLIEATLVNIFMRLFAFSECFFSQLVSYAFEHTVRFLFGVVPSCRFFFQAMRQILGL